MRATLAKSVSKAHSRNPLLAAAFHGNAEEVKALLERPDASTLLLDSERELHMTPLAIAIQQKHPSVVRQLLATEAGKASAIIPYSGDVTPLLTAVENNDEEIAEMLLALPNAPAQTEIQTREPLCMTPLVYAVNHNNLPMVRRLVAVPGATQQALLPAQGGFTPLLGAAMSNNPFTLPIMGALLGMPNAAEQMKATNGFGCNALALAVQQHDYTTMAYLLKRPEAASLVRGHFGGGMNVLVFAASTGDESAVTQLLRSPHAAWLAADPSFRGENALMSVVEHTGPAYLNILDKILALPAANELALQVADNGQIALMVAVREGNIDAVRRLLTLSNAREQASLRCNPHGGYRRLDNASKEDMIDFIQQGLMAAQVESQYAQKVGVTPLQYASMLQKDRVALDGMRARDMALSRGHTEIAALLLAFEDE